MPSVEYNQQDLIKENITREVENPDTGEIVEVERDVNKHPFEVRIFKWLEKEDGYHIHGFVEVTEFGEKLIGENDSWSFVKNNYILGDKMSEQKIGGMLNGIRKVREGDLESILRFGNVDFKDLTVKSEEQDRIDFEIVLKGQQVFDVDWLKVDFDPSRGGK